MSDQTEIPPPPPLLFVKQGKPAPKSKVQRSSATVYYHIECLKEIHLYLDEHADTAKEEVAGEAWSVEYVSSLNNRFRGRVKSGSLRKTRMLRLSICRTVPADSSQDLKSSATSGYRMVHDCFVRIQSPISAPRRARI